METMTINQDGGHDDAPSAAVIKAIAELEGSDPVDLEQSLYDVIDPDALDTLFANDDASNGTSNIFVRFTYGGYRVQVTGDGDVKVASTTKE